MKKMLFIGAALAAILAGPALAQDRHGGDRGERPQMQRDGGDRGGFRGGDRGEFRGGGERGGRNFAQRENAPAPQQAPQPQQAQPNFDRGGRNFAPRDNAPAPQQAPQAQPNVNRGGNFAQRNDGGRDFNRGGNDNRFQGNRFEGNRNSYRGDYGRNDYGRNGRDYGRNFNGRNGYGNQRYSQYYRSYNAGHRYRIGNYYRPSGWYYRRWTYGDFLPSLFWSDRYWLTNYYAYDLAPPLPGTVWVRYGDDALLIDRYTGEVIQVAYGIFW